MTLFRYRPHYFSYVDHAVLMLTSLHLHMKSSEVCIKTRSPPASLPTQGQVTKHTTVKWPIARQEQGLGHIREFNVLQFREITAAMGGWNGKALT